MLITIFAITLQFLLLFFLIRGALALYICSKIKKNRHREDRKKGQSFVDWLFYRRFSDVIPKSEMLYWFYYVNIILYFLLFVSVFVFNAMNILDSYRSEIIGIQLIGIGVPVFIASERNNLFRKK